MGVYIFGVEMPPAGTCKTITIFDNGTVVKAHGSETLGKAIPVPEHGRTIDADALDDILADQSEDAYNRTHAPRSWERALSAMRDYLEDSPTIIPADPPKEET